MNEELSDEGGRQSRNPKESPGTYFQGIESIDNTTVEGPQKGGQYLKQGWGDNPSGGSNGSAKPGNQPLKLKVVKNVDKNGTQIHPNYSVLSLALKNCSETNLNIYVINNYLIYKKN